MEDRLSELYYKYSNFTKYRNEALNSVDEENEQLKIQIKELELEKKRIQLEYEVKIHELKSQVNTTQAKARLNDELNNEKADLKKELYAEIVRHHRNGVSARDIADHIGLSSTTLIYQAINSAKHDITPTVDETRIVWNYFDNAAIHRYAVSDDRKYIKVHGANETYKIVTSDELNHVSGEKDITINPKRIRTALDMFDGKIQEGDYIARPNPYQEAA